MGRWRFEYDYFVYRTHVGEVRIRAEDMRASGAELVGRASRRLELLREAFSELKDALFESDRWHELNASEFRGAVLSLRHQRDALIERLSRVERRLSDITEDAKVIRRLQVTGQSDQANTLIDDLLEDLLGEQRGSEDDLEVSPSTSQVHSRWEDVRADAPRSEDPDVSGSG